MIQLVLSLLLLTALIAIWPVKLKAVERNRRGISFLQELVRLGKRALREDLAPNHDEADRQGRSATCGVVLFAVPVQGATSKTVLKRFTRRAVGLEPSRQRGRRERR